MACYHTLTAWKSRELTSKRRFGVTFRATEGWKDKPVDLPCGKCIGCRLRRAQDWGNRVMHELKHSGLSSFITLTYDDEHLPPGGTLRVDDLQRFWKRLRKKHGRIRYFACGEYGERTNRPHYHAIAFGYWPEHRVSLPRQGLPLYRSRDLEELWPYGHSSFGEVTRENAVYIAKYTLGKYDDQGQLKDFGGRTVPYLTMSLRPGIGHNYAREHARALARFDGIRLRGGHLAALPRYYETVMDRYDPSLARGLKTRRVEKARAHLDDTPNDAPLPGQKEQVTLSRVNATKRSAV